MQGRISPFSAFVFKTVSDRFWKAVVFKVMSGKIGIGRRSFLTQMQASRKTAGTLCIMRGKKQIPRKGVVQAI